MRWGLGGASVRALAAYICPLCEADSNHAPPSGAIYTARCANSEHLPWHYDLRTRAKRRPSGWPKATHNVATSSPAPCTQRPPKVKGCRTATQQERIQRIKLDRRTTIFQGRTRVLGYCASHTPLRETPNTHAICVTLRLPPTFPFVSDSDLATCTPLPPLQLRTC